MFESFEKRFKKPPQESKESFESDKEKIEQEAAQKRGQLLDNVLDKIFTEKGEVKDSEDLTKRAVGFLKKKSNFFRAATASAEAYGGKTMEGRKLTTKERIVRGVAGIGSLLVCTDKVMERHPLNLSGPDEERLKEVEEKVVPWLRDMADYEIKGKTEMAMRNAAEKEKDPQQAEILKKSADFLKNNSEETQKAETDIEEILEQREIFEKKE